MPKPERYHVLLIGCDQYPPNQRSLRGCVNDIDAIEGILLNQPGVGVPESRIHVTRLAAPRDGSVSASRYKAKTRLPTRQNIIAALQTLAGADVSADDRVLIYYSGHGGQVKRSSREGWFECLVASDNLPVYDDELNALIGAIANRTSDLTIMLDCCHAAGATRDAVDEPEHGATRFAEPPAEPDDALDPAIIAGAPAERIPGAHLLQRPDPNYLVVAACQAYEKAQEDAIDGNVDHGFLTHSLLQILNGGTSEWRAQLRWADIWPRLLHEISLLASKTRRAVQHPWVIGRPERRIFGGFSPAQDAGFQISRNADGTFIVQAGTLVGVTVGAILGVYGRTPDRFPEIKSDDDKRAQIGQIRVVRVERATCLAEAIQQPPEPLPEGVRARVVEPGQAERLRVWLDQADPNPAPLLRESDVLEIVESEGAQPEVWVNRTTSGWEISNDTNRVLAQLKLDPPAEPAQRAQKIEDAHWALRAGLESYARYNQVLRLAKRCADPALDQQVLVTLLDCSDAAQLQAIDPKRPALPELPRNAGGLYEVRANFPFCVRLTNLYWRSPLHVTVFGCSSGGLAQFLGTVTIMPEDIEILWMRGIQRDPFQAIPDNPATETVDRIVAIATTREGADLSGLAVDYTVQEIFDQGARALIPRGDRAESDLWTAVTVPMKIGRLA